MKPKSPIARQNDCVGTDAFVRPASEASVEIISGEDHSGRRGKAALQRRDEAREDSGFSPRKASLNRPSVRSSTSELPPRAVSNVTDLPDLPT
jgi:hypothetical protein